MAQLSFVLLCFIWGSSFILMERAAHAFGAIDVAFGRVAGGALALGIIWLASRQPYKVAREDWPKILFAGFIDLALPLVILAYCVAQGHGHSYFGMLIALVPLATIFVSVPMLGTWPSRPQWIGVLGGLGCLAVLVLVGSDRGMSLWLVALAMTAPLSYGIGNTYIRWKLAHIPAVPLTALMLALASLLLLPLEFFPSFVERLHLARPQTANDWPLAIESIAFLGIVGTGIAWWMFNRLIIRQGPLVASMVTYVFPLVALGWGIYDGDQPTGRQLWAMCGVLSMVALVQFSGKTTAPTDVAQHAACGTLEFCPAQVAEALLESRSEPE